MRAAEAAEHRPGANYNLPQPSTVFPAARSSSPRPSHMFQAPQEWPGAAAHSERPSVHDLAKADGTAPHGMGHYGRSSAGDVACAQSVLSDMAAVSPGLADQEPFPYLLQVRSIAPAELNFVRSWYFQYLVATRKRASTFGRAYSERSLALRDMMYFHKFVRSDSSIIHTRESAHTECHVSFCVQSEFLPRNRRECDEFNRFHFERLRAVRGERGLTPKVGRDPLTEYEVHYARQVQRNRSPSPAGVCSPLHCSPLTLAVHILMIRVYSFTRGSTNASMPAPVHCDFSVHRSPDTKVTASNQLH